MRSFLSALLCFICVAQSYGQTGTVSSDRVVVKITKEKDPKRIYTKVEITPTAFPGGDSSWAQSLEETLNQTLSLKRKVKAGTYIVSVAMLIEKDGSMVDIRCVNDPGFGMCEQVVAAVKRNYVKWAKWSPSKVRPYGTSAITPQLIISSDEDRLVTILSCANWD